MEEAVAVSLELAITRVVKAVDALLATPSAKARAEVVTALDLLDDQTATADAYAGRLRSWGKTGDLARSHALGSTSDYSAAAELPVEQFDAQVALIKAAKAQLKDPSPANLTALAAAADAVRGFRDP